MRQSSMRFQPYGIAALALLSVAVNSRLLRAAALDVNAAGPAPDLAKLALFVDDLNSFLFSQRVTTISSARDKDGTRQEQIFSGGGFTLTKAGNYEHRFHARKVKLKKDAEEVLWDNRPRTRITLEGPKIVVYYLSDDGSQIVGGRSSSIAREMGSCFIPAPKCKPDNGCLQSITAHAMAACAGINTGKAIPSPQFSRSSQASPLGRLGKSHADGDRPPLGSSCCWSVAKTGNG